MPGVSGLIAGSPPAAKSGGLPRRQPAAQGGEGAVCARHAKPNSLFQSSFAFGTQISRSAYAAIQVSGNPGAIHGSSWISVVKRYCCYLGLILVDDVSRRFCPQFINVNVFMLQ